MANPTDNIYSLDGCSLEHIEDLKIAVINTEWNPDIISILTKSCKDTLLTLGITEDHIETITVPGSFELPLGAKYIIGSANRPDAVICLGCVIQGETKHDDYINNSISKSISQLSLMSSTPVIFGVLTTNTAEQAIARADGKKGDKGKESAYAALKMIGLKQKCQNSKSKISF